MRSYIGGTFDNFHRGHREFLLGSVIPSEFTLVGLTSDSWTAANCRYKSKLQTFQERKEALTSFLYDHNLLERAKIEKAEDIIGPSLKYEDLSTVFCTPDSREDAELVSKRRVMRALPPLRLIEIPLVLAEDGLPISSTRIRKGEIDIEGKLIKNG